MGNVKSQRSRRWWVIWWSPRSWCFRQDAMAEWLADWCGFTCTFWKIKNWNLQITHEKKGKWAPEPPSSAGVIHVRIYLSRHVKTNKMAEFKLECHQQYDPNERSQRIVGKGMVRHLITHTTFIFVMDSLFVMSISGCWPSSWTHGHGFVGLFCQTKVFEKQEAQFPTVIMLNNYVGDLSSHQTIDALKSWVTKASLWNTWHKRPISGSE